MKQVKVASLACILEWNPVAKVHKLVYARLVSRKGRIHVGCKRFDMPIKVLKPMDPVGSKVCYDNENKGKGREHHLHGSWLFVIEKVAVS